MSDFILDSQNVLTYLQQLGMLSIDPETVTLQQLSSKNFNILVTAPHLQPLLVKQERIDGKGEQVGELYKEWQLQQLIHQTPTLRPLSSFLPAVVHCDQQRGIVVNRFWLPYTDCQDYYDQQRVYPPAVATELGRCLGLVHKSSFEQGQELIEAMMGISPLLAKTTATALGRLHTGIFTVTPIDCLRFYKLYQQYPSLGEAVEELAEDSMACCLTHNDLNLNNILLHNLESPPHGEARVRIIDWERAGWGDPAVDLGMCISSYLQLWLENLIVGSELSINESLQLALVPLNNLQPTMFALVSSYLQTFPQILAKQPHYLRRVLQYTGLCLIRRIEAIIENDRVFNNQGIAILQVAKQLLCHPLAFTHTIFGSDANQIIAMGKSS
jgi:Phosphotransferase enzyme family